MLNAGEDAQVLSVSCGSAGNCVAGGVYHDGSADEQAFVVSQRSDRWGKAIEVPGTATSIARGVAQVVSVSCASVGNCAAGGSYGDRNGHGQAFVASQRNGRWGTAIEVPGTGALNAGDDDAEVLSVSCSRLGPCAADGYYLDRFAESQGFVCQPVLTAGRRPRIAG